MAEPDTASTKAIRDDQNPCSDVRRVTGNVPFVTSGYLGGNKNEYFVGFMRREQPRPGFIVLPVGSRSASRL
jgi:hypothetical protein